MYERLFTLFSGSKHLSQDGNVSNSNMNCNGSPTNGSRYERNGDQMKSPGYSSVPQRPYSSPDNLQRQAVVNNMWQQAMAQPSFSTSSSQMYYNQCGQSSQQSSQRYDSSSQQKSRVHGSHPYLNNGHHYSREVRYRGNHEEHYYEERARENRWRSSRN
ncbi:hypothetical protein GDO86_012860 [Hymenochirus boettgeri]|uniref:Uncharacterized protein n=1 Tax=Hymenochirus boettgeri TaxID=247094 RepID=A0A8T2ISV2_9PIPI|nr:hypothetical protein GDO86_012860 [Hymenochirus boettgeri]